MKNKTWLAVLSMMLLTLAACTREEPTPEPETPPQEEPQTPDNGSENDDKEPKEFEAQIKDTIVIEGMEEPITLDLYDKKDAPFLTYVPTDLTTEEASGGEGDAHWFYANYNNEKLEDIYLQIYLFSDNVTEQPSKEDEDSTYSILVEKMVLVEEEQKSYDWAIEEYISASGSEYVMLGEHNNRYFFMEINSEPLYSEGFFPRANKVIEHLYWKDTGEYLTK